MPTWLTIALIVFVGYPLSSIIYCARKNRHTHKVLVTVSNDQDTFVP